MITCNFAGGLGNNLFQLANLYNIHKKYNTPYFIDRNFQRLTFDGKILKKDKRFKQSFTFEIPELFENKFVFLDEIKYNTDNMFNYFHYDLKSGDNFLYKEVQFKENCVYHGYYQSEKYFSDFNIKEEFILNKKIVSKIKDKYKELFKKPCISIQYRLGGDRKLAKIQKFHKNLTPRYYRQSISEICELNGFKEENINILLFSDDISLAKRALEMYKVNFIPINNENNIEDFIHMSLCDHNIIGNSTFAWWSSYFNNNKGTIIAPKDFFGANYNNFKLDDFYPKHWLIRGAE